jgi:hypothetical protein
MLVNCWTHHLFLFPVSSFTRPAKQHSFRSSPSLVPHRVSLIRTLTSRQPLPMTLTMARSENLLLHDLSTIMVRTSMTSIRLLIQRPLSLLVRELPLATCRRQHLLHSSWSAAQLFLRLQQGRKTVLRNYHPGLVTATDEQVRMQPSILVVRWDRGKL